MTIEHLVLPTPDDACRAVAAMIVEAGRRATRERHRFDLGVSGGTAPRPVYRLLAGELREQVAWAPLHLWFSDERCVPPDDERSNYGLVKGLLLDHVPLPAAQVHRLVGEIAPAEAAARGDAELRTLVRERPGGALFDLMLLGAGPDGHTASLFPGHPVLDERERLVTTSEAPPSMPVRERLTMTYPALARSATVVVLATGREKRDMLREAVARDLPVARVRGRERTVWVLDEAAAE